MRHLTTVFIGALFTGCVGFIVFCAEQYASIAGGL